MSFDTQLEIYLPQKKINIYRASSISNTWLVLWLHCILKFLSFLPVTDKKKNVGIYNGLLCEEWFLLTSLHFKGFARTITLPPAVTAQLLVKTASDFKSLQGFKNQWCFSICILKKAARKQTKQVLKMYSSTLFQSISILHSYTHLGDIIRYSQLYQYCQWLMGIGWDN